jgi:hypothetical protein
MQPDRRDIRKELAARMAEVQKEVDGLRKRKVEIDKKLEYADQKLRALRAVFVIESECHGEPGMPLFAGRDQPSRFTGMRVGEAIKILKNEDPHITKDQAYKILVKEKFDFGTKRAKSSVHFAWIALERAKSGKNK